MAITAAEKVLIAGGVLNLAYGALLGYAVTVTRVKGAPATPKYLMTAHVSALPHAAVLTGFGRLAVGGPACLYIFDFHVGRALLSTMREEA